MLRIVATKFDKHDYLTRGQTAEYLRAQGMRCSERHLANLAANNNAGNGPPYYRTRWTKVFYSREEVAKWWLEQVERVG